MASSPDSTLRLRRLSVAPQGVRRAYLGHAQLSLVEHALCPLDAASALGRPFLYETQYAFTDQNRHRRDAHVRVACPEGLSATDEFYLWGLLSLTFSQPQPMLDFYATPYYCLRQLGCIDAASNRGSKNYNLFRSSIRRLSTVSYRNDRFYDPIRGEHRDVGFGFLSYSLPIDPESSRAWRFAWDPIFFDFCQAASGSLRFDLHIYRSFDPACRRLYLLLKKIFWRCDVSPEFDLHELAINVIGFAASHAPRHLKRKIGHCIKRFLDCGVLRLPPDVLNPDDLFTKRAKGHYSIRFHRGPHFLDTASNGNTSLPVDSPLFELLRTIGLDDATTGRILKMYDPRLIAECADMTIAAKERKGMSFFKNSPQAFFIDNLKEQAAGRRTPPDWWRAVRKEEERRRWQADRESSELSDSFEEVFNAYLQTEAREAFDRVMDRIFQDLKSSGQSDSDAKQNANHFARTHFVSRFRAEHPEWK
jgi:hypothetical protein